MDLHSVFLFSLSETLQQAKETESLADLTGDFWLHN